jgi:hypothetical protein
VITSELEPTVDSLLDPIGRLFDELDCYESDQLPPAAGVSGLTCETLCDHVHTVDVAVRALQLRALQVVERRRADAPDVLHGFVRNVHLRSAPVLDTAHMRASVLQQVARMETLIMPGTDRKPPA